MNNDFHKSEKTPDNNIIESLGLLKNGSVPTDLFAKMETDVTPDNKQQPTPEEIQHFEEQKRANEEYQRKQFEREYLEKHNSLSDNYFMGFIGALLGGLAGAIPWAIISCSGWFVSWLGYIIAITASKGYDLMKVKVGIIKIWFVAISIVISIFAGQIISDMLSIAMDSELSGMFSLIFEYYKENFGEYLSLNASNLLIGLLFAALGGFSVLKNIKTEISLIEELKSRHTGE